jgi:hypothetical protein
LRTQSSDIAFRLFFGIPIFIVEHHDAFRRTENLLAAVARVNGTAVKVQWSSPAAAVSSSWLLRRSGDTYVVRSYSRTVRISNDSDAPAPYRIEWWGSNESGPTVELLRDGIDYHGVQAASGPTAVTVRLEAGSSHTFALVHRNDCKALNGLGLKRTVKGFLRRRASELRDNYLSKNPALLTTAAAIQKKLLRERNALT